MLVVLGRLGRVKRMGLIMVSGEKGVVVDTARAEPLWGILRTDHLQPEGKHGMGVICKGKRCRRC